MKAFLPFLFLLATTTLFGQTKLCRLFADHAVLQRQKPLPVWGLAKPNEAITVYLRSENKREMQKTTTNTEGSWRVTFPPFETGETYKMTVETTSDTLVVSDILFGEVWLCSGQSNMEWTVANTKDFLKERKNANFPQIRHFKVETEA